MYQCNQWTLCNNYNQDIITSPLMIPLIPQAGPVEKVCFPSDPATGWHRCYGFVEFEHKESVSYAIQLLDGIRFFDRPLRVRSAGKGDAPSAIAASPEAATLLDTLNNAHQTTTSDLSAMSSSAEVQGSPAGQRSSSPPPLRTSVQNEPPHPTLGRRLSPPRPLFGSEQSADSAINRNIVLPPPPPFPLPPLPPGAPPFFPPPFPPPPIDLARHITNGTLPLLPPPPPFPPPPFLAGQGVNGHSVPPLLPPHHLFGEQSRIVTSSDEPMPPLLPPPHSFEDKSTGDDAMPPLITATPRSPHFTDNQEPPPLLHNHSYDNPEPSPLPQDSADDRHRLLSLLQKSKRAKVQLLKDLKHSRENSHQDPMPPLLQDHNQTLRGDDDTSSSYSRDGASHSDTLAPFRDHSGDLNHNHPPHHHRDRRRSHSSLVPDHNDRSQLSFDDVPHSSHYSRDRSHTRQDSDYTRDNEGDNNSHLDHAHNHTNRMDVQASCGADKTGKAERRDHLFKEFQRTLDLYQQQFLQ